MTGDSVNEILRQLNDILKDFDDYFQANRLTVNTDKTKYMIFNTTCNKKKDNDDYNNKDITVKTKKKRNPKYPCGECQKQVRIDAIVCDNCNLWFHRKCIPNMSKDDMLTIGQLYPNRWTCYNCIRQILPLDIVYENTIRQNLEDHIIPPTSQSISRVCNNNHNPYIQLIYGNMVIERVTNIKFLGIILTDTLNWNDHMLYVCSKMNKSIGYFYKARKILDHEQLINLYKSFVEPYIIYCLPIWGGYINCNSASNPITKTINRFKRIITYSKRTHIADTKIQLSNLQEYYTVELT